MRRDFIKKLAAKVLVAATVITALAGCGASGNTPSSEAKDDSKLRTEVVTTFCQSMVNHDFKSLTNIITGENTDSLSSLDLSATLTDDSSKKVYELMKAQSGKTTIEIVKEEKKDDNNYDVTVKLTYSDMSTFKDLLMEKTEDIAKTITEDESLANLTTEERTTKMYELLYQEIDKMKETEFNKKTVETIVTVTKGDSWKVSNAVTKDWGSVVACEMNGTAAVEASSTEGSSTEAEK